MQRVPSLTNRSSVPLGTIRADYAQTMTVAIPVIPYSGLSALLGVNGKG